MKKVFASLLLILLILNFPIVTIYHEDTEGGTIEESLPIDAVPVMAEEDSAKDSKTIKIYLTYDDGPTKYTETLLDILKDYGMKATFFMVEGNMKKYPEAVKRVISEGHTAGLHSVSHRIKQFYKTDSSPLEEMSAENETLYSIAGIRTNIIRTPYGSKPHLTSVQRSILADAGYIQWDWNVDSLDWKYKDPEKVYWNVFNQVNALIKAKKTPVILLHDGEVSANAAEKLLRWFKESNMISFGITESDSPVRFYRD